MLNGWWREGKPSGGWVGSRAAHTLTHATGRAPERVPLLSVHRCGRCSCALQAESGVVVRMLDALNKHDGAMWEPCPHGTWCAKYGAIWPSTLINREHNAVWYAGKAFAGRDGVQSSAGLVLAPPPLNRFFCIYPRDGNA